MSRLSLDKLDVTYISLVLLKHHLILLLQIYSLLAIDDKLVQGGKIHSLLRSVAFLVAFVTILLQQVCTFDNLAHAVRTQLLADLRQVIKAVRFLRVLVDLKHKACRRMQLSLVFDPYIIDITSEYRYNQGR